MIAKKYALICEHGQLKRSCAICELEDEVRRLKSALKSVSNEAIGYAEILGCRGLHHPAWLRHGLDEECKALQEARNRLMPFTRQ